METFRV